MIAAAAGGAILGDNVGFWIGREFGFWLLVRYGECVGLTDRRIKLGQYLFLHHGGEIVFFGRFVAILRAVAAILAGANCMSWPSFRVFNGSGGIVWAMFYGLGAYYLGKEIEQFANPVAIALGVAKLAQWQRSKVFGVNDDRRAGHQCRNATQALAMIEGVIRTARGSRLTSTARTRQADARYSTRPHCTIRTFKGPTLRTFCRRNQLMHRSGSDLSRRAIHGDLSPTAMFTLSHSLEGRRNRKGTMARRIPTTTT